MADQPPGADAEFEALIELSKTPGERRRAWIFGGLLGALVLGLGLHTAHSFAFGGNEGDFIHWYDAARAVLKGENIYLYEEVAVGQNFYNYLPMFSILLSPLALLPMPAAGAVWTLINTVFILAFLLLSCREVFRRFSIPLCPAPFFAATLVAALLLVDKLHNELRLGQSDAFIGLWMVLALVWLDRRPVLGGIALGVVTNIKLQGLVFPAVPARPAAMGAVGLAGREQRGDRARRRPDLRLATQHRVPREIVRVDRGDDASVRCGGRLRSVPARVDPEHVHPEHLGAGAARAWDALGIRARVHRGHRRGAFPARLAAVIGAQDSS